MLSKEEIDKLSTTKGIDAAVEKFEHQSKDLVENMLAVAAAASYFIRTYNELVRAIKIKYPDGADSLITASKLSAFTKFLSEED